MWEDEPNAELKDNIALFLKEWRAKKKDMIMWVARDADNAIHLFKEKPIRQTDYCPFGYWRVPSGNCNASMEIDDVYPDLKWEGEPIEVEIVIKNQK